MRPSGSRSVIVTGAASGIGEAITSRLASEGRSVVAFDRSPSVEREWFGDVVAVIGDASSPDDVANAVDRGMAAFGGIDGAVAVAGIVRAGTVETLSLEAWNDVVRVNLTGVFLLAQAVLPAFKAAGSGSFVSIASQIGMVGYPQNVAYASAKAGVINLMRCMAIDHGADGVRANAVCPGPIDTPLTQVGFRQSGEDYEVVTGRVPLRRMGKTSEISGVVSFLLSDEAAFVNGAAWAVDGGYTAQ